MSRGTGSGVRRRRRNALAAWTVVATVGVGAVVSGVGGDFLWTGLGLSGVAVAAVPALAYRDWTATLPWEVPLFVAVPYVLQSFDLFLPRSVAAFLVVPALALAVAVEFDAFTPVEMSPGFAVVFVVTVTMAAAGGWAVVQWAADLALGTENLRDLQSTMWSLTAATGVGILAGLAFAGYFRQVDRRRLGFRTAESDERSAVGSDHRSAVESDERAGAESADSAPADAGTDEDAPADAGDDADGFLGMSDRRERQVVRGFQAALVAVLLAGLVRRNVGIVVNALVALGVMELPALLERDYRLSIDPGITLWIVVSVFLHAVGTLGLYHAFGLWDNLTHALSSSVVAAAGYATVRAYDVHDDAVVLPRTFTAAYILLFTLAFGVLWEILEFGLDGLASMTGTESVLAQISLANTMTDLVFNLLGGVLVAVWGAAYLSGVSRSLADQMAESEESE